MDKSTTASPNNHIALSLSPWGKILTSDVSIAKNYLKENELESMGRIVSAFLDLAEERAKRHIPMTMEDWSPALTSSWKAMTVPSSMMPAILYMIKLSKLP